MGSNSPSPADISCTSVAPTAQGKATLLRVLAGLLDPDAGSLSVDGVEPSVDRREYQRRISYVSAGNAGLQARLSVERHLMLWARLSFVPRRSDAVASAEYSRPSRSTACGRGASTACPWASANVSGSRWPFFPPPRSSCSTSRTPASTSRATRCSLPPCGHAWRWGRPRVVLAGAACIDRSGSRVRRALRDTGGRVGMDALDAGMAVVERDLRQYLSIRGRFVAQGLTVLFTSVLFYYVSRLVEVEPFDPEAYFGFVMVGIVTLEILTASVAFMPATLRAELLAGDVRATRRIAAGPAPGHRRDAGLPILRALITGTATLLVCVLLFGLISSGSRRHSPRRRHCSSRPRWRRSPSASPRRCWCSNRRRESPCSR